MVQEPPQTHPAVDRYLNRAKKWQAEFILLRNIFLTSGMNEDFKWGHPCYKVGKGNVALMHGFNDYCAILFFKGALLKDPQGILIRQTENTQAARQIRFTQVEQIIALEPVLKNYLAEAIEIEKSGLKVDFKPTTEFTVPEEFQHELKASPELKAAFAHLTPGRQRAYLLHFSAPKQAKTRVSRIQKYISHILNGKGLEDV